MRTGQRSGADISLLCSLSGYTRQAYYKEKHAKVQSELHEELVIQQVMDYRKVQKTMGPRKLHYLLKPFMKQHQIRMGRDGLFDLLRFHHLLTGKKSPANPGPAILTIG